MLLSDLTVPDNRHHEITTWKQTCRTRLCSCCVEQSLYMCVCIPFWQTPKAGSDWDRRHMLSFCRNPHTDVLRLWFLKELARETYIQEFYICTIRNFEGTALAECVEKWNIHTVWFGFITAQTTAFVTMPAHTKTDSKTNRPAAKTALLEKK